MGLTSNESLARLPLGVRTSDPSQLPPCTLPPDPVFPSFPLSAIITILFFTLPESTIRSPAQVYHSALTVPFQFPDISRSCHPLGLVLRRTTAPRCIHRALHVLRASPRVCCCCRRFRDTFLAYPTSMDYSCIFIRSWSHTCSPSISILSQPSSNIIMYHHR